MSDKRFRGKMRIFIVLKFPPPPPPTPLPPQTMVILLFPRLHRPQRLHNIKLRAGNIIELRLNVKELKEEVNYGKVSFSECVSITFVASCSLIS